MGSPLYQIATGVNPDLANEVGWRGFVDTVGQVVATVPSADASHTIVLAKAYQQAGASNCSTRPMAYASRRFTRPQRLLVLGPAAGFRDRGRHSRRFFARVALQVRTPAAKSVAR